MFDPIVAGQVVAPMNNLMLGNAEVNPSPAYTCILGGTPFSVISVLLNCARHRHIRKSILTVGLKAAFTSS
ncbi:hypothetical protein [Aureimonas sp. AU40]|uniref:hypothetical protein n=1 Tax=Aureimonas sp. AU40 TaxID=1637747 RepID=UPI000A87D69F|nr:hypothetical protein [Aureimonas sp. AU40]